MSGRPVQAHPGTNPSEDADNALPSVSVVVATRDRPELLARAVRGLLGQRYPGEIECVLVFDRCEPVVPDVEVGSARTVKPLTNSRTPGLAGARNTGVLAARGTLVAFCDDDDEWLPDKLMEQVRVVRARPDGIAVATGITVAYGNRSVDRVPSSSEVTLRDLLRSRRMDIHPSSILIRRSAFLDRVGPVDEDIPGSYGEDYEWLLRAARLGPVLTVQKPLVRVHWDRPSYFANRWQTIIESLTYLLSKHPEFHDEPRGLARIYGRIGFAHAALGERLDARRWALRSLRTDWRERRGYLTLLASAGLVSTDRLLRLAHRFGRGI